MDDKHVIETLNEFLKGQYMGIHAYEHLIEKLNDPIVKDIFQNIQKDHKQHAISVSERIQNIGGKPVDDEGMIGAIQGFISQFTIPGTTEGIIESAIMGEGYYGVKFQKKSLKEIWTQKVMK